MARSWQRRAVGVGVVLVGKDEDVAAARLHHGFEALVYAQVACMCVVYAHVACICVYIGCLYVCVCVGVCATRLDMFGQHITEVKKKLVE